MKLFQNHCSIFLIILAMSCTESKKPAAQQTPGADTANTKIPVRPQGHQPDPSITVNDDFSKLSVADLDREDQTHMDMAYFPSNYAFEKANKKPVSVKIRVIYGRPHKRGRSLIFGNIDVVPFGEVWRLGANESTEAEFMTNVEIAGKKIAKGRYTVFAIPYPDKWTLIINSDLFTWGDFNYDQKKDVLRTDIATATRKEPLETFVIYFQKTAAGADMIFAWDNVQVVLPVKIL